MPITRVLKRKKVFAKDSQDVWLEVDELYRLFVETGQGAKYQRTIFEFRTGKEIPEDGDEFRKFEKEKKKIRNPNDFNQFVELPITKEVSIIHGQGAKFKRIRWIFDNTEDNMRRKTRIKKVEEGPLEVEVILALTDSTGQGAKYQAYTYDFNPPTDEEERASLKD